MESGSYKYCSGRMGVVNVMWQDLPSPFHLTDTCMCAHMACWNFPIMKLGFECNTQVQAEIVSIVYQYCNQAAMHVSMAGLQFS